MTFKYLTLDRRPLVELCDNFPDEIRHVLEFGLRNRARLTSLFGRMSFAEEGTAFLIRWLGVVGNRGTLQLLEPLVDNADFGQHALEAVRHLKAASRDI
jgi:hypothetical protein